MRAHFTQRVGIGDHQQLLDPPVEDGLVEPLGNACGVSELLERFFAPAILMASSCALVFKRDIGSAFGLQFAAEGSAAVLHQQELFAIDDCDMGFWWKFHRCAPLASSETIQR